MQHRTPVRVGMWWIFIPSYVGTSLTTTTPPSSSSSSSLWVLMERRCTEGNSINIHWITWYEFLMGPFCILAHHFAHRFRWYSVCHFVRQLMLVVWLSWLKLSIYVCMLSASKVCCLLICLRLCTTNICLKVFQPRHQQTESVQFKVSHSDVSLQIS